jgi:hypothetical protein
VYHAALRMRQIAFLRQRLQRNRRSKRAEALLQLEEVAWAGGVPGGAAPLGC